MWRDGLKDLDRALEGLPFATILYGPTGETLLRTGALRRMIGQAIPSVDDREKARWSLQDHSDEFFPLESWPSKRALRGEINTIGFNAILTRHPGAKARNVKVFSSPITDCKLFCGGVSLLSKADGSLAQARKLFSSLEPRFVEAFFKSFTQVLRASDKGAELQNLIKLTER